MLETSIPSHHPGLRIAHWVFDPAAGQINAFDDRGRLLLAIATSPLFGARLAAAFSSPPTGAWQRPAPSAPTPMGLFQNARQPG
ncbi:MAG: hypothetical protein JF607_10285 [Burkholderiales bacterium]|jgi:hypothetical protein|nr:hypothetical protein [Burkholderiales bacterium]